MAVYTSYDVVGKKEDVSDIISNISPTNTPFLTMIGKDKIHNTLFQWQEDVLANPNLSNAQVDGFVASDAALVPTVLRNNVTQILQKTINIAETTDAVARYGRAKETAYQVAKAGQELKRDLESILLSGQALANGSDGVARTLASFQAQVGNAPSYAGGGSMIIKTGGSTTAMTETVFVGALQQLYINGVDPSIVMVPPSEGLVIPGYAQAAGRYRTIPNESASASKKLVNVVDLYVSPFGEVKVVMDRFQLATDYLIFDPGMWQLATLRPWARETLAKVGDSTRMMIVGEYSLKHKNYAASAIVRKSA